MSAGEASRRMRNAFAVLVSIAEHSDDVNAGSYTGVGHQV
jgi:hypothetical protein